MLRKKKCDYRLMAIDDDEHFLLGLEGILKYREGYALECHFDHDRAIEILRENKGKYDLLLLDYMLNGTTAKQVVQQIRKFDRDIYIVLLTAKSDTPPLETMQDLNIQNYCGKSATNYESDLLLSIYSALTSVDMMNTIRTVRNGFKKILNSINDVNGFKPIDTLADIILSHVLDLVNCNDMFLLIDKDVLDGEEMIKGTGKYDVRLEDNVLLNEIGYLKQLGEIRLGNSGQITLLDNAVVVKIIDITEEKDIGYIWLDFDFARVNQGSEDFESILELLKVYANQAALTISNSISYARSNNQKIAIERHNKELNSHIRSVIDALRTAIDNKDQYTRGHSDRVADFALMIGKFYGFNRENEKTLQMAGWFHDVGKIGVAEDILFKPEKLTKEEFDEIKKHPDDGARILSAVSAFRDVLSIVNDHHERLDGTGYPKGLDVDEIDTMTRIISVADSFDAMTSGRVYRKNMTTKEAIDELILKSNAEYKSGSEVNENGLLEAYWYDRNVVNHFIKVLISEGYLEVEDDEIKDTGKRHPSLEKVEVELLTV